jgi:hypothetical protein
MRTEEPAYILHVAHVLPPTRMLEAEYGESRRAIFITPGAPLPC